MPPALAKGTTEEVMLDKLKAAAPAIIGTVTVIVLIKQFWPTGAAWLAKIGL